MSFVKTAAKKVFSFFKKVVKSDVFKWVAVAAIAFFAAGVSAGGFSSFTGVSGVGQFFTAVGQTMATGAASIASMMGWQSGASSIAQHGGASAIQAGFTDTAYSAGGDIISADIASGQIVGEGGAAFVTNSNQAVNLSAKALANEQAKAALLGIAADPDAVTSESIGLGSGGGGGSSIGATGGTTQYEKAVNTIVSQGQSAGISGHVWKGLQSGFVAMLSSSANKERKKKTFVAGGLSQGGPATIGSRPFFAVGGKIVDQGPLAGSEQAQDTAEAPNPSVAYQMSRDPNRGQPASSAEQLAGQAPAGTRAPAAVGSVQQEQVAQQPAGVLGVASPAAAPTSAQSFYRDYQATNIQELAKPPRSILYA